MGSDTMKVTYTSMKETLHVNKKGMTKNLITGKQVTIKIKEGVRCS